MKTNHPAHGPVSLDRLHQISEILSKAVAQSDGGNLGYAMADAAKVIDGAIAAFDAEPVAWTSTNALDDAFFGKTSMIGPNGVVGGIPLYTVPPAQVVPDTLPCPVHLEPGLKFGKGVRTQCMLDALRRRADYYAELEAMTPEQRAEHDSGAAEFKAMLGTNKLDSFKATIVPEELVSALDKWPEKLTWSHHDDMTQAEVIAWNNAIEACRDAMLQAGNSPVTPDCWIPVSERMPDKLIPVMVMYADGEMWSAMWSGQFWDDGCTIPDPHAITHWREMPAAPKQEVKSALEHGMQRYAGAMQKLSEGDK
ncbi:DUF551 domain-containing protein [Citrobacter sp. Cb127]|uniref:DUF551 domain-containing protein n=1 Tax=Citrobacter sp. Cb127 TaxID=2985032 RepID=UPI00257C1C45|nr:DUF551 domain-containing protein [Citrobacter sp. Cb127]MDM3332432.1 DUF551 domain-containing protein [Citrobacter sp. Cb127]